MMYPQLELPHIGNNQGVLHIFACLKAHTNSELVFGPGENSFEKSDFPRQDWTYSIYHIDEIKIKKVLPPDMPKPSGKGMNM